MVLRRVRRLHYYQSRVGQHGIVAQDARTANVIVNNAMTPLVLFIPVFPKPVATATWLSRPSARK